MDRNQAVYEYVKAKGPILPVNAAKEIGDNVLLTSAILSGLVSSKMIKMTRKRVGSSPLYFMEEQKEKALEMLYNTLNEREKKELEDLKKILPSKDSELTPQQRYFTRELIDFLKYESKNNEVIWHYYKEEIKPAVKEEIEPVKEKEELKSEPIKKTEPEQKTILPKETIKGDEFAEKVKRFLTHKKIRILQNETIRINAETDYIIEVQSDLMPQKYYLKARKKKTINEKDLTMAWFEGKKKDMPMIYLTTGDLSKKAKQLVEKELGDSFKFLKIKV